MHYRDEFDGPDIRGAIGSFFRALGSRRRSGQRGRPVWAVGIVGTLVLFLGAVLWYSYPRATGESEEPAVPIIRADAGPYRVAPSDPGGMEIPHRDSTVFDTLRASREESGEVRRVENLLGEPEEPVAREKLFAGLETEIRVEGREIRGHSDEPDAPAAETAIAQQQAPAEPATPQVQPVIVAAASEQTPEAIPETAPETEQAAEQKIASAATPTPKAKPEREVAEELSRTEPAAGVETFESGGGWYAQLASLRSNEAAQTAWKDLQKSMSVLQPVNHRIEKADLGSRGTYYRLQAGPFTEAKARDVCAAVQAQKPGGCLVVKN